MKKHKGFIPKFYLDSRKNIIRGKVLNVRDTITFHGKTVQEAWNAFRDSVDDYLEFCKKLNVEPEKPFNGQILVRMKPSMHRALSERASEEGTSINALIQRELERTLSTGTPQEGITFDIPDVKKSSEKVDGRRSSTVTTRRKARTDA